MLIIKIRQGFIFLIQISPILFDFLLSLAYQSNLKHLSVHLLNLRE